MSGDETTLSAEVLDADVPSQRLRASVSDFRRGPAPELDWQRIEAALMARVTRDQVLARRRIGARSSIWIAGAVALAAAASFSFYLRNHPDFSQDAPLATLDTPAPAGVLIALSGSGDVRIGDQSAPAGATLAEGVRIEASSAVGVFERPGKVRWLLEQGSAVTVERADAPLVLALERGATEAQVVPVSNGEAFAVDVTSSRGNVVRIAVHGTHLRVARTGDHVTVDLSEGVVSIGAPPKRGSTLGELVTAPAHVELDVDDVAGSLRVQHDAAVVRAPVSLDFAPAAESAPPRAAGMLAPGKAPSLTAAADAREPELTVTAPAASAETVAGVVRGCQRGALQATGVTVTVSTTVALRIGEDGYVQHARFSPPLSADVQDCIARVLYDTRKTHFDHAGELSVPVEMTR